jgi:large subunit ribosomal protein L29
MKFEDVSGLSVEELRKKAQELSKNLFEMKMKNSLGQLGNPLEIRFVRRDIARVKTAINQKTSK